MFAKIRYFIKKMQDPRIGKHATFMNNVDGIVTNISMCNNIEVIEITTGWGHTEAPAEYFRIFEYC